MLTKNTIDLMYVSYKARAPVRAVLAESSDLYVENNCVYYRGNKGPEKVGAIYRRLSDEYLDPLCFNPESVIGVPNLMAAYRAGNVAIINTPGT